MGCPGNAAGEVRFLERVRGRLSTPDGLGRWSAKKGPTGALLLHLWRLGWDIVRPTLLQDEEGVQWELLVYTPAYLAKVRDRACRKWISNQAKSEATISSTQGVIEVGPLRKLLGGRAQL